MLFFPRRWSDEGVDGTLCATKEFLRTQAVCADVPPLSDDEDETSPHLEAENTNDATDDDSGIDISVDPYHGHNLSQMKKKEHEGI